MTITWIIWCIFVGSGLSIVGINIVDNPVKFLLWDGIILFASYPVFLFLESLFK